MDISMFSLLKPIEFKNKANGINRIDYIKPDKHGDIKTNGT